MFSASGARWPCGIRDQFVRERYVRSMALPGRGNRLRSRPCSTPSAIPCSNSYQGRAQKPRQRTRSVVFRVHLTLYGGVDLA